MFIEMTSSIDLAEILFTLFWVFFAGLVFYLRREDKREGYPLQNDRSDRVKVQGFPAMPKPKEFRLAHGGTQYAPRDEGPEPEPALKAAAPHPGAPGVPTGDPMVDGVGPAAWAKRADTPDLTLGGEPRVLPLRAARGFSIASRDSDLRGWPVRAAGGDVVGEITDLWVDVVEPLVYYVELRLSGEDARQVLVPFGLVDLKRNRREAIVDAAYPQQFRNAPRLSNPDRITLREEDRVSAYFAGGLLYADERRAEPLL